MPTKRRAAVRVGAALLGLWAGHGHAQNLLTNPDFASDLAGWIQPRGGFVHDAAAGSPAAGSVLATNTQPLHHAEIWLEQCLTVVPGRRYEFGMRYRPLADQANTGDGEARLLWNSSTDCTDEFPSNAEEYMPSMLASWTQFGSQAVAPASTHSVRFWAQVRKIEAGGSYQAHVDHAFVREVPAKGDFDGDGQSDLVLYNATSGESRIWFMNGVARLSTNVVSPTPIGVQIVASDDFDGDGKSDLVLRDSLTGAFEFWRMDGATRAGPPLQLTGANPLPSNWRLAATGDFNHDGHPDLLLRNLTSNKLLIWTMNGAAKIGAVVPTPDQAVDANWSVAAALDLDGDGNRDLLWYNATSGKIVLWRLDASAVRTAGEFTSPDSAGSSNWKVLAGGDYGLGAEGVFGSSDIVWRNATSGKFVVWHMDPDSVPLTRTSGEFTNPDGPNSTDPTSWTIVGPK